jgi:hypothetical protein
MTLLSYKRCTTITCADEAAGVEVGDGSAGSARRRPNTQPPEYRCMPPRGAQEARGMRTVCVCVARKQQPASNGLKRTQNLPGTRRAIRRASTAWPEGHMCVARASQCRRASTQAGWLRHQTQQHSSTCARRANGASVSASRGGPPSSGAAHANTQAPCRDARMQHHTATAARAAATMVGLPRHASKSTTDGAQCLASPLNACTWLGLVTPLLAAAAVGHGTRASTIVLAAQGARGLG